MRRYRLLLDIPFLERDRMFDFEDETGQVYAVFKDGRAEYSLRPGLAGYLWLLLTEDGYLERVNGHST